MICEDSVSTQYVSENIMASFFFSVEVVTKHKAKTLAYIPKYNFKLLSSNKSLIIIMIWCD